MEKSLRKQTKRSGGTFCGLSLTDWTVCSDSHSARSADSPQESHQNVKLPVAPIRGARKSPTAPGRHKPQPAAAARKGFISTFADVTGVESRGHKKAEG